MKRQIVALTLTIGLCLGVLAPAALGAAPTISPAAVSGVTTDSATLEASINPQGKATSYHFEYGLSDCASNPCTSIPVPDEVLAKGEAPVPVAVEVKGLSAGTTYHFRVVAKNAEGETQGPGRTFMTYLEPQKFGPCPNESLRTENPAAARIEGSSAILPDCRAYEQVTPVDKDGGDATDTVLFAHAAVQGGAFSYLSVSGVPGGKGSQELPAYLAQRGEGGWSTNGMLPPGKAGQQAKVLGWTPDFSDVFSRATLLGEPRTTALLDAEGAGALPGPVTGYVAGPGPIFVGATAGGAEVFFESKAAIPGVAGALEGEPNLYVWDKASNQLRLAGTTNQEAAPPAGAHAGSYDWVNGVNPTSLSEGGAERNYYTEDQHAFAADGSAVYFTEAGTGKLYVRLNPTAPQSPLDGQGKCTDPAKACTIAVSATQRTKPDPAGSAPAAFMAASADGRNAFFTSTEMLTNDANTGPEQEPPAVMLAGLEGENRESCVPSHAQAVAVDSEHVYWIDLQSGAIGRATINCTEANDLFITPAELEIEAGLAANPRALAVQNGYLYWAAAGEEKGEGTIGRAKLNGTGAASEVEPEFIKGVGNPQGVATDSEHLYWTDSSVGEGKAFIGKAKLDGSEAEAELVDVGVTSLTGIAVDGEHIYWVRNETGVTPRPGLISRAKLDGSEHIVTYILIDLNTPNGQGLAVQGNHIYWAAQNFNEIGRAQLNGEALASEVQREFIKNAGNPKGLAADASNIYWTAHAEAAPNPGKDLYRYDPHTGTLTDLTPDQSDENGAEVRGVLGTSEDGSYVYFAANGIPDGVTGSPNARGESAEAGECAEEPSSSTRARCNLYLWHEGEVRFIARLEVGGTGIQTDAADWVTTPNGVATATSAVEKTARVSPDGKTLLFRSQRQLSGYENEGTPELYLYRLGAGLSCVSCNPTGEAPTMQPPRLGTMTPTVLEPGPPASTLSHNLSAGGNRVLFETTEALAVEDTNGEAGCPAVGTGLQALTFRTCTDTYEWEAPGTGSCTPERAVADGGCIYLLSTGKGSEPALIGDASGEGGDVFFFTRSRLVGQDEDSLMDVYDARVDGGLASQNPPPPSSCGGIEGCRPQGPAPAPITPPPSFSGPGNPKAKRCPKGKHEVKGRCVKRKTKKHKHPKKHGSKKHARHGKGGGR